MSEFTELTVCEENWCYSSKLQSATPANNCRVWWPPIAVGFLHALNYTFILYTGIMAGMLLRRTHGITSHGVALLLIVGFIAECLLAAFNMNLVKICLQGVDSFDPNQNPLRGRTRFEVRSERGSTRARSRTHSCASTCELNTNSLNWPCDSTVSSSCRPTHFAGGIIMSAFTDSDDFIVPSNDSHDVLGTPEGTDVFGNPPMDVWGNSSNGSDGHLDSPSHPIDDHYGSASDSDHTT